MHKGTHEKFIRRASALVHIPGRPRGRASCPSFASPQDVLACVQKNHPDVLRAEAEAANLDAFDAFARQRPNPELDAEAVSNSEEDEAALSAEAAYLHTFEMGGKRRHRLDRARAQKEAVIARVQKTREEVTLSAVLNLYRLRHLQDELHAVEEAQNTFGTIIGQYKNRRQLSPEQQVSLNVFLLAQSDYTLRKSRLLQEQRALKRYFDLATGADFPHDPQGPPPSPRPHGPVLPPHRRLPGRSARRLRPTSPSPKLNWPWPTATPGPISSSVPRWGWNPDAAGRIGPWAARSPWTFLFINRTRVPAPWRAHRGPSRRSQPGPTRSRTLHAMANLV
ncbi:MAG: TolC family protein [Elusimicrobia bacterium]|nr:TolC family protein [Elusimicrobiota bacterium]